MKKIKIFCGILLLSLIIPSLSFAETEVKPLLNRAAILEKIASTTEIRLKNREDNIERIRARIASSTSSTTEKRIAQLNSKYEKQSEKLAAAKDRLLNKELKIVEVLEKIAGKITKRINILETNGSNLASAKAKLKEATDKIDAITAEATKLATSLKAIITKDNKDQLFIDIKASQDNIRTLAKEAKALLVDTIKEITKVLPTKSAESDISTTTN